MPATTTTDPGLRSYLVGLGLALLLTAIPFAAVAFGWLPMGATITVIAVAGIAQAVVHFRYFLHLRFDRSSRGRLLVLVFSALLVALMVGGTLWIMFDLNARMM